VVTLEEMVIPETAGEPSSEQKWVHSSLRQLSRRLAQVGHSVSPPTVSRLLKKLDYSLKANVKKEAGKDHPDRDEQFRYIDTQKQIFQDAGLPMISVDTKKKELIGNFKNSGQVWCKEAEVVNVHDFPQDAVGRAVPYGIYELSSNRGSVYVGTSADTPKFAVDAISSWWQDEGKVSYPHADQLLILADSGGSNSYRSRVWKRQLQDQLSDQFGLKVTVCHYPTGCSRWNPVEYRLFSHISLNWMGKPLRTFDSMLAYIRGTTTTTGLTVKASLVEGVYEKGQGVSDAEMETLNLERHETCPNWNYTLRPRPGIVQNT